MVLLEKHRICISVEVLSEIYSSEQQNWDLSNKWSVTVNESKSPLLFLSSELVLAGKASKAKER